MKITLCFQAHDGCTNAKKNLKQKKLGFWKFLKHGQSHIPDHDCIKFIVTFQ